MRLTYEIDPAVMPNVTAARQAYNANLPVATGAAPGAANPSAIDSDEAFVKAQLDAMVRGWIAKYALLPPPPAPPDPQAVPEECTRKQGLKALARAEQFGLPAPITEAMILAAIDGMPATTPEQRLAKTDTRIEFLDAKVWKRQNPFTQTLGGMLQLSSDQVAGFYHLAVTFTE